jgi:2-polyprenyl-6-methoxyphenol hydroxylase-like FAD-dependent oxidoreductase
MFAHDSYDAIVVGARCAGAATAMLLARKGWRVLVIDRGSYGTDTISTHALMRGGVLQLHRWGVLPDLQEAGTPPVREATFRYGDDAVTVPIAASGGVDALYAPRRTLLDSALVRAARESGATVRFGHTLMALTHRSDGRVSGGIVVDPDGNAMQIEADLVIGADGAGSLVARLAAAETLREARNTTSILYGYFPGLQLTGYQWWYQPGIGIGAIPTNDGRHCVFAAISPQRLREGLRRVDRATMLNRVLRQADADLAEQVAAGHATEPLSVFSGRRGFIRQACGPGWALVGDAGYFKDPITAHGITDALRDAELLANAASAGALEQYQAVRDALSHRLFETTDAIAGLDWDLDQLKTLHQTLNQAMKQEVQHLLALPDLHQARIQEYV